MVPRKLVLFIFLAGCWCISGCRQIDAKLADNIRRGDRHYREGNLIGAEQVLTAALQMDSTGPAAAEAYYLRGLTRLKRRQTRQAEADFLCAVALAKRKDLKADCHVCLGSIAYGRGNFEGAYEHYRASAKHLPPVSPSDRVLYRLGESAQRLGKWREGRKYLGKVIRDFPHSETARLARKRVGYDFFTIQAGAFRKRAGVRSRLADLRRAGLAARSTANSDLQIVYVGKYSDFELARASLDKVKQVVPDARIVP